MALAVEPAYTRPWRTDNRNNHAYWAGLAVAATGDTTGDPALVAWGLRQAELGIAQIRPDGTLPLEMARGARALHYDLFALTPLVMTAEIGLRHGVDLYAARHGALRRLAERALAGLDDPAWFAARAGAPQDAPGHLPPEDVAWMEPYYARFHDPGLEPWLDRLRPIRSARLGGNVTEPLRAPGLLTEQQADDQLGVEGHDHAGHDPGEGRDPAWCREVAEPRAVGREADQRDDGERQLEAEDHLAQDQELRGAALAGQPSDDDDRDDRDQACHQASRPGSAAAGGGSPPSRSGPRGSP